MTVSKTTTLDQAREYYYGPHGGKPIRLKDLAEFADSLTAELQKENARLKEVVEIDQEDCKFYEKEIARLEKLVEWAAKVLLQHMNDEDYEASLAGVYATLTESALNPPKGGALPKGLSKEKAK